MTDVRILTDTFGRADGVLSAEPLSDSGYVWTVGGANLPYLKDGQLTMDDSAGTGGGGGGYSNCILQRSPQRMEADFNIQTAAQGDSTGTSCALVLQASSKQADQTVMIHYAFRRLGWNFEIWHPNDGTPHDSISFGNYATPWVIGGSYSVALEFFANAIVVTMPDGNTIVTRHQDFRYVVGKHITFQVGFGTGNNDPKINVSRVKAIPSKRLRVYEG